MDESADWCVSKRPREDLRGWNPAGSLRATIYETGVRNLPEPESVSSSAYQRTAHREARETREGCALIVAHFQAAASGPRVCMCVYVCMRVHTQKHLETPSCDAGRRRSPADNRSASRSTGERERLFSLNMQGVLWRAKGCRFFPMFPLRRGNLAIRASIRTNVVEPFIVHRTPILQVTLDAMAPIDALRAATYSRFYYSVSHDRVTQRRAISHGPK